MGIQLINADELIRLMRQAFPGEGDSETYRAMCKQCGHIVGFDLRKAQDSALCPNGHKVTNDLTSEQLTPRTVSQDTFCDLCGRKMRVVTGRYGKFWGCTGYPRCRHTKLIENTEPITVLPKKR